MSDLAEEESDSSVNESYSYNEDEAQSERFENATLSAMEDITGSDQQTEFLDSTIPVMRLRGGAPKKRRRRAYFQGSSSQPVDEMRVEIKTESQMEGTEPDADITQELTAEAIALLNEENSVPDTTTRQLRREQIQILNMPLGLTSGI
jgi:hypothetical protein